MYGVDNDSTLIRLLNTSFLLKMTALYQDESYHLKNILSMSSKNSRVTYAQYDSL